MKIELRTYDSNGWQELTVDGRIVAEGTDLPLDIIKDLLDALQIDYDDTLFDF